MADISCENDLAALTVARKMIVSDGDCPALNVYPVSGTITTLSDELTGCSAWASLSELLKQMAVNDGDCFKLRTVNVTC
jgi:hypothetical protein